MILWKWKLYRMCDACQRSRNCHCNFCWNWTAKNIPDPQKCLGFHFQRVVLRSTKISVPISLLIHVWFVQKSASMFLQKMRQLFNMKYISILATFTVHYLPDGRIQTRVAATAARCATNALHTSLMNYDILTSLFFYFSLSAPRLYSTVYTLLHSDSACTQSFLLGEMSDSNPGLLP